MTPPSSKSSIPTIYVSQLGSPLGLLHIAGIGDFISWIGFDNESHRSAMEAHFLREMSSAAFAPDPGKHARVQRELEQYFAGKLRRFTTKLHLFGTPFQMQVWTVLRTIPFGVTTSYSKVAEMIGNQQATRAVGGAVGRNPVSIIVPCHRVIGERGMLVGYAGGIDRKKWLLQNEGAHVKGYDPVSMHVAARELPEMQLAEDAYDLAEGCDAIVVCTEWNEFRHLDMERIRRAMRSPVIYDGRNIYDPDTMARLGFRYYAVGRSHRHAGAKKVTITPAMPSGT